MRMDHSVNFGGIPWIYVQTEHCFSYLKSWSCWCGQRRSLLRAWLFASILQITFWWIWKQRYARHFSYLVQVIYPRGTLNRHHQIVFSGSPPFALYCYIRVTDRFEWIAECLLWGYLSSDYLNCGTYGERTTLPQSRIGGSIWSPTRNDLRTPACSPHPATSSRLHRAKSDTQKYGTLRVSHPIHVYEWELAPHNRLWRYTASTRE